MTQVINMDLIKKTRKAKQDTDVWGESSFGYEGSLHYNTSVPASNAPENIQEFCVQNGVDLTIATVGKIVSAFGVESYAFRSDNQYLGWVTQKDGKIISTSFGKENGGR